MRGAVAVDLGATSGRFAAGRLVDGRIEFEVVEQIPHSPLERNGRLEWDLDRIFGLTKRAAEYASAHFDRATLGIDSWGVDHGFLDQSGDLIGSPVCYRDESHARAYEKLKGHRPILYSLTGIQHQPFNTVNQLAARREEDPSLPERAARWLILPDLLGWLFTREANYELTQASTTQLLGLDNQWSAEAFKIAGWPVPDMAPSLPGGLGGYVADKVRLAHVGSHDTASAVCGFGALAPDQIFLNVGTWSLVGCVLNDPIATPEAEAANFTNERMTDGRVRFLRNVPGFYVVNRLHEELGIKESVPQWLGTAANETDDLIDLFAEDLFNPESMLAACSAQLKGTPPRSPAGWADLALQSLTHAIASQRESMERLTGRTFRSIRVGGGGSQSQAFCQSLADKSGLEVQAGPAEATVLGNLALQFRASGDINGQAEMDAIIARSATVKSYSAQA
jgi:rhamnulokinase